MDSNFWQLLFWSAVFGVFMAFAGLAFLNIADKVPKMWVDNGDFDEVSDAYFYAGECLCLVTCLAHTTISLVVVH